MSINSTEKQLIPKFTRDLKTKDIYLSPKESEYMGFKYHLGHTGYLNRDP